MLSLITFIPVIGAVLIILLSKSVARTVALVTSLAVFVLSLVMLNGFNNAQAGFQYVELVRWIPQYGINYKIGVDGINLWLVMLTTFIFPITIWASSWTIKHNEKTYYALILLMQMATLGVFLALDMFLFYVFWEFALVPMYFIIGMWGGQRRIYASLKFFIYTMTGSVLMLIGILVMGVQGGTFDYEVLVKQGIHSSNFSLFLVFLLAFVIKVPMFPFHSWLPDAHVEAPTPGSVILAAVLLKMGSYGLIRYNLALFPAASQQFAPVMIILSVVSILYGAIVAFAQGDMKKLIAYSSVSHMGYIVLGIFSLNQLGVQGAILQMINHGLSTGGLFLIVGYIYERLHTREMIKMGGLWAKMPVYGTLSLILVLSSVGLPALNGFVGEYVILQGAFMREPLWTALATLGMILGAVYLLTMYQKVFLGKGKDDDAHAHTGHEHASAQSSHGLTDLSWSEIAAAVPIILLCFYIGFASTPFFNAMNASVLQLLINGALAGK
jgi:NADH-quinone oxidoreductase subunit M